MGIGYLLGCVTCASCLRISTSPDKLATCYTTLTPWNASCSQAASGCALPHVSQVFTRARIGCYRSKQLRHQPTCFPGGRYASFKAIETPDTEDDKQVGQLAQRDS
jgi:hypothetical protein